MDGWDYNNNIRKLNLNFSDRERRLALAELQMMNINEESLFPGLDGFCRSLRHRLGYFLWVDHDATAVPPYDMPELTIDGLEK
jgi:hypothetical protein